MSLNWMRHFELQLLDNEGNGIVLSDFKVTFDIKKLASNNFAGFVGNFRVYNLSSDTQNRIMGKEFSKIKVIAGYDGMEKTVDADQVGVVREVNPDTIGQQGGNNYGLVFNGDIRFTITGKDNATDSWIFIQCIDCWEGHLASATTVTLSAGWKWRDIFTQGMKDYSPYLITQGAIPDMPVTVFPRGRTMFSPTREVITDVARQCDANWWYENGQVNMRPEGRYLHEAIVLNANTGLIGMPKQTMGNGVNVQCLINPNIKLGGLIRLDQASVYRTELSNDDVASAKGRIRELDMNGDRVVGDETTHKPASINTDGDYIVGSIDYRGDTRGTDWYMFLVCIAKGSTETISQQDVYKRSYS